MHVREKESTIGGWGGEQKEREADIPAEQGASVRAQSQDLSHPEIMTTQRQSFNQLRFPGAPQPGVLSELGKVSDNTRANKVDQVRCSNRMGWKDNCIKRGFLTHFRNC